MRPLFQYKPFFSITFFFFVLSSPFSYGQLTCANLIPIERFFLTYHYSIHDIDESFAENVLDNYMRSLDPLKLFFLEKDRERILSYKKVFTKELAKNNCHMIEDIYASFSSNFEEVMKDVLLDISNKKFDYTVDEYISFDRKNMSYPKDKKERSEAWRKFLKYRLMVLEENLEGDEQKARIKLKKNYELIIKDHKEEVQGDIYETFLSSFSMGFDPHTSYLSAKVVEDFNISTRLSLQGIGASLRSDDGITTVESLIPGGPAHKGKLLKIKDQIIGVAEGAQKEKVPMDFVDIIDMNLRKVVSYIRGAAGTTVTLKIRRDKETQIVSIVREKINLKDQEAKSTSFVLKNEKESYRVGLIDLPSFYIDFQARSKGDNNYKSSTRDVIAELKKLTKEKIDLLVLDLRSNGGGALDEAITLTGLFTGKTPVVQIKTQTGEAQTKVSEIGAVVGKDLPIILMINRQSASASEIIAGALQDYDRALLVGEDHTYGKGTVQNFLPLEGEMGAVKYTISKFYRPLGSSTQLKGVYSHISFPGLSDRYEIGEKHYPNPLSWDAVKPLQLQNFNMVKPHLPTLLSESNNRRKKLGVFKKLEDLLEEYDKKNTFDRVSLKKEKPDKKLDPKQGDKTLAKDEKKKDVSVSELEDEEFSEELKPNLNHDSYLLETLYIAGDYIRLLQKKKLGTLSVVGFVPEKIEAKDDKKPAIKDDKKLTPKEIKK
jgi:carboxyl-terminal processing protease